jgi:hypothetical protein
MEWVAVFFGLTFLATGVWVGVALADLLRSFTDMNDVWEDEEL